MLIVATQKYTRQTSRKVRIVANAVRKLSIEAALKQLAVIERRSSLVILKVVRQALANAWHNHNLKLEDLTLNNILVEPGPTYKRFRAVSRGRAHTVLKRTCHVKVILESKTEAKTAMKKAASTNKKAIKTDDAVAKMDKNVQPELAKSEQKIKANKAAKTATQKQTRIKSFGGRK